MSFKYDLDKLLDPCGIEKLHKTITRITKPRNEYSAMSSAMEALEKATQPWNKNSVIGAAMANVAGPWDHKSSAMEALEKATQPWNKNSVIGAAMANVAGPWDHKSAAMEALEKATQPWNRNSVIGAAMANVAGPWDHKSAAMEAIKKYASSITINESLGLEADTQKILAATTLMPDLKTKIQSLHHKISNDLWLERQNLINRDSTFIQNNKNITDNFNQLYGQELHIDKDAAQAIDSVIHDTDALNIASELIDIGIFDTSSGSIIYDYFKNTPEPQRNNIFINFVIPIILTIAMSISSEIELIQSNKNQIVNSINNIKGHAVLTSNSFLRATPDGENILEIEKNTLIEVYKTDNLPTGWVLVKLNKDNIDIKGYLNISDIKPLIDLS